MVVVNTSSSRPASGYQSAVQQRSRDNRLVTGGVTASHQQFVIEEEDDTPNDQALELELERHEVEYKLRKAQVGQRRLQSATVLAARERQHLMRPSSSRVTNPLP